MIKKTKMCPICKTKYGGTAQVCKHCPERLVYIDTGELVPLIEVAVPPYPRKDITHWYTHIHVYLNGIEMHHCQHASTKNRFIVIERALEHLPDETLYGDVELVFGEPDVTPMMVTNLEDTTND